MKDITASSVESPVPVGALDGVTILRYAHIYRDRASGGIEQQLRILNEGLLRRHNLTLLQTYLVREERHPGIQIEKVGRGQIIWVPMYLHQTEPSLLDGFNRLGLLLKKYYSLYLELDYSPGLAVASSVMALFRHRAGHFRYKSMVLSDYVTRLYEKYNVDLVVMHWMSYDANHLIERAVRKEIPFVIINHFENSRFALRGMIKAINAASGIGSVSAQRLPPSVIVRCVNLSDAIDTAFFDAECAHRSPEDGRTILLLPARIQVGKGHNDMLRAAQILRSRGIEFVVYFVGAIDSEEVYQELQCTIERSGLSGHVVFLGEKSQTEIRDLFAASRIVVLPSRSEGLPRVLLEAQAMRKPVVAYNSGGMSEALLPDESGYLVEPDDSGGLADRIMSLLRDEATCNKFGRAGRDHVKHRFSIDELIHRHEVFYLSALTRQALKPRR